MIRQAELADFDAVVNIRQNVALDVARIDEPAYRVSAQRDGFLLPTELTLEEFANDVSNYLVTDDESAIPGYLCLHSERELEPGAEGTWFKPRMEDIYYSDPHAYIYGVGVLREVGRRGVAGQLLEAAEARAKDSSAAWLFSMIVTSPVTNVASMLFHEKNGFERVALLELGEEAGLTDFQNLVYAKQLALALPKQR